MILTVRGVEVHPGWATGKLVNALRLAARIVAALPSDTLTPETTEEREGFIHPLRDHRRRRSGARCASILRDFDEDALERHRGLLERTAQEVVDAEPRARLEVEVREQYRNMRRLPELGART